MIIRDTERKEREGRERVDQTQHWARVNAAREETRSSRVTGKEGVTHVAAQKGNWLTTTRFAQRVRKLNRDITIEPHPALNSDPSTAFYRMNKDKACVWLNIGDTREYLMVCEGDWMPEWSVMSEREARRPYDPNKPRGYWVNVPIAGQEIKRGWRTVLIRLIRRGVLSLEAVEREFGSGQRESWKVLTGKGPGELII